MNNTTLLVLQLVGPAFTLLGLGMLLNKKFYLDSFEAFTKNAHLLTWAAFINLVIAAAILTHHNLWSTPQEVIVSLIGIFAGLKGLHMTLAPKHWLKRVPKYMSDTFMTYGSFILVLFGLYMVYNGYLA